MIRTRFHGRGGQGIKTASQIFGTAAFLSGYQVQDFPLYGAERRGAPIVAFTRLDRNPVLERGPILKPDLLIVGDETLMEDPIAAPLNGVGKGTRIFINTTHEAEAAREHYQLKSTPWVLDLTALCEKHLGKGHILSSALAAVASRLLGTIPPEFLHQALTRELEEQGIRGDTLKRNLALAEAVYEGLPAGEPFEPDAEPAEPLEPSPLVALPQESVTAAAPLILAPANLGLRKTGNWRVHRPEIDYEHCNACWICFIRCPDGAIHIREDGKPAIDYDHCKGCLICAQECPSHVIHSVREVTSW